MNRTVKVRDAYTVYSEMVAIQYTLGRGGKSKGGPALVLWLNHFATALYRSTYLAPFHHRAVHLCAALILSDFVPQT